MLARLQHWSQTGAITPAQYDTIAPLVRKDRFSVVAELNALLYLGVLSFVAGVGWTIQTYFASLGDVAVLSTLSVLLSVCLYYCFSRALPFSAERVNSPTLVFDYVLYLSCLLFSLELGYVEFRLHLLEHDWDYYILISAILFFMLAYRFDNRFVLSLALSTLAGWFGLRFSRFGFIYTDSLRAYALIYGALVGPAGVVLWSRGLKRHFLETYLHVAANVLFLALFSGVLDRGSNWSYLVWLLAVAAAAIVGGVRFHRFAFVSYGAVYGYIGLSVQLMRGVSNDTVILAYVVISATAMIASMVLLARRLGRQA
jgi:hypothetical protein